MKFKLGALYVPVPELITLRAGGRRSSFAIWAVLRYTDLGKALRAAAEDAPIAAAFGVNQQRNWRCCWPAPARRSPASPASASR